MFSKMGDGMQLKKFYTPEEISKMLTINIVVVRRWLTSGKLRGIKVNNKVWRVPEEDLKEFLDKGRRTCS